MDERIFGACDRYKVTSVVSAHDPASVVRIAGVSGVSAVVRLAGGA